MPEGLAAAAILFFGALVSGASGFGFALLSLTLLSLSFEPKLAVAFMAVQTLTQNVIQSIGLRRYFHLKELLPLLVGGVIGVPAGVLFLKAVDPMVTQRILGVIVLVFVITSLVNGKAGQGGIHPRSPNLGLGLLTGASGGVLMGAFLSGGPPLVMYQLWKGDSKFAIKATLQAFFLFCNAYTIVLFISSGILTAAVLRASLSMLLFTVAGTLMGMYLFRCMPTLVFRNILLLLLAAVGCSLLVPR